MDAKVLEVQQWLNETYTGRNGYTPIEENGKTGSVTVKALITALQIELGISTPTGTFGPQTRAACPTLSMDEYGSSYSSLVHILQGAMWCKGYNPGYGEYGYFNADTEAGVQDFQIDAGLPVDGVVTPMIFEVLLNTDGYVLSSKGNWQLREIQQELNRIYAARLYPYIDRVGVAIIPCDGIYERKTNKVLIAAFQLEIGILSEVPEGPTGSFGDTTLNLAPMLDANNNRSALNRILRFALFFNNYPTANHLSSVFDQNLKEKVAEFQKFMCLPIQNGVVAPGTWASLMSSKGDTSRPGTGADMMTPLTSEMIQTLKDNGYQYVGRYISGGVNKKLTAEELERIFNAGLRLWPIYQTVGNYAEYFTAEQGKEDALAASRQADEFGFPTSTVIYFAADFDAYDYQVENNILPYFKAVYKYLDVRYQVGVYGSRNTCQTVSDAGYAVYSFVGDMSTGFSGNLGFAMPTNWAFDQILEYTVGSGAGSLGIDKNIVSGRDQGIDHVNPDEKSDNVLLFNQLRILYDAAVEFRESDGVLGANSRVLQYLRHSSYSGGLWDVVAGNIEWNYIRIAEDLVPLSEIAIVDPITKKKFAVDHLALTANSFLVNYPIIDNDKNDLAGWAGDMLSLAGAYDQTVLSVDETTLIIGSMTISSKFGWDDFIQDIDGLYFGMLCRDTPIYQVFREYYTSGYKRRYQNFLEKLEASRKEDLYQIAYNHMANTSPLDVALVAIFGSYHSDWNPVMAQAFTYKIWDGISTEQSEIHLFCAQTDASETKIDEPFTVEAVSNKLVTSIALFSETGTGLASSTRTHVDEENLRHWTFTVAVGTPGNRVFDVKIQGDDKVWTDTGIQVNKKIIK